MRLWSLHPGYLDARGLVALWREALLARKVLEGKTTGYRNHPQLTRFRNSRDPAAAINYYLYEVYREAERRGYRFQDNKLVPDAKPVSIKVTRGQLGFEREHLLRKLETRDKDRFGTMRKSKGTLPHPLFRVVPGKPEEWERQNNNR